MLKNAFGLLALAIWASACVPAANYDRTKALLENEQAAGRVARARIAELEQRLVDTETRARNQDERQRADEEQLAAAKLEVEQAETARDNALGMVEQLRGELGRAGDHLKNFSDQKQELSKALANAEARSTAVFSQENADLIRDIALAFHEQLSAGRYELTVADGKSVLLVPLSALHSDERNPAQGKALVAGLAQFLALHSDVRLALSESTARAGAPSSLARLQQRLIEAGVAPARVELSESTAAAAAERKAGPDLLRIQFVPGPSAAPEAHDRTASAH